MTIVSYLLVAVAGAFLWIVIKHNKEHIKKFFTGAYALIVRFLGGKKNA